VITVASEAALQAAVDTLTSGTTIVLQPGTYRLTRELRIRNGLTNVGIRGATTSRDDVVILGSGMESPGINIALKVENAQDVLIANLSIGQAYWHALQLQGEAGAERVRMYNVRLFDTGQQLLKSTVDPGNPNGVDDVTVEYSLIEYSQIGPSHGYTEGIDVHHGARWTIRHNLFRNIRVPESAPDKYRPAILMWSGSRDTVVHGNMFVNCERGIIFGLGPQAGYVNSHVGGAIYNNVIWRAEPTNADAGISLWDSPGTQVVHNTVIQNGTYPNAIEYRFPSTTGVTIANNLTDGAIGQRDGAQAAVVANYTAAAAELFVDAGSGDLHLATAASQAIDQGVVVPEVGWDWDGDTRPSGTAPDLGADEARLAASVPVNQPPVAAFTTSVASGPAPLTVTFDGSSSSDPEGAPLTYAWSFGDGGTAAGASVTRVYTAPGSFTATLTVQDSAGATATSTATIAVSAPAIVLQPPTDLRATASRSVVNLAWTDIATGESRYVVERAVAGPTLRYKRIATLPANASTFADRNVKRRTDYVYRVAPTGANGQPAGYSNPAPIRVP
jgi:PKD repeat protein